MNLKQSIYNQDIGPFLQASFVFVVILVFLVFGWITTALGMKSDPTYAWLVSCSMLLFFSLFNAVLSLSAKRRNTYWLQSVIAYISLAAISGVIAWLYSGLTMNEAGAIKWLYFVITFGWLLFLSIVRAMKKVVNIAMKQDKRLRGEE